MEKCYGILPRNNDWQARMKAREEIKIAKREAQLETKKEVSELSKAEKAELALIKLRNSTALLSDIFDPHRHTIS